eukprot:TRINITY_DN1654_c0_g4_i1.p1 TRINITY_DN1654_c0_g4~~TRINITY_DN1654_c0_g4_i1.p1  ORF type:complete len:317 (-),score=24.42 TRINITY_DN1654_c0_g4_i1:2761-3711(-)
MSETPDQYLKLVSHPANKLLTNIQQKKPKSVVNELFQSFGNHARPFEWTYDLDSKLCSLFIPELSVPGYNRIQNMILKVQNFPKVEAHDILSCSLLCWLQDHNYLPAGSYSEVWRSRKLLVKPEIRQVFDSNAEAPATEKVTTPKDKLFGQVRMVLNDYKNVGAVEEQMEAEQLILPINSAIEVLEGALGYQFRKKSIIRQACHHASSGTVNWRLLCMRGSVALSYIVLAALEEKQSDTDPGMLTTLKNEVTKKEKLYEIAGQLGLEKFMVVSYKFPQPAPSASMMVEMLQAIIGAIDRDGGFFLCRDFVLRLINI